MSAETTEKKNVLVIGCGFSGLSAATYLADRLDKSAYRVTILEKNDSAGGRARRFEENGFTFDMGPSWYWMPDIIEDYFNAFGKHVSDYYKLVRLDPSYRVFFSDEHDGILDIPSDYDAFKSMLDTVETGSSKKLDNFLAQGEYNYRIGIKKFMRTSGLPLRDVASVIMSGDLAHVNMVGNLGTHIRSFFKDRKLIELMEFPAIFLGSVAKNLPAMYSLMNYIDIKLGTWYPMGGMYELIAAMVSLAEEKGVTMRYSSEVRSIETENERATRVILNSGESITADLVVASADYHHVDRELLDLSHSNYSEEYWDNRAMAPSALLFFLGVDKRLKNLRHHNLFFDGCFDEYTATLFDKPNSRWPEKPFFYVSAASITDPTIAPEGMENLFILIPLQSLVSLDTDADREACYDNIMCRLEQLTEQEIRPHVVYRRSYAHRDFVFDYHAFKGNAYGLSNTIAQTALFKPRTRNNTLRNLYYTGQLTAPGPGVPTCILSGEIVANELMSDLEKM